MLGLLWLGYVASAAPTASTECGEVSGAVEDGVNVWRGIPYAAPPVGPRRWTSPANLGAAGLCWHGTTRKADTFGAACPQSPGSLDIGRTDEDCLFVNIWAPQDATGPLPVMFWVHGGGYVFGSGAYPNYGPTVDQAAAMGVVLVSFNYRLGPFGWLATAELSADNNDTHTSGNYGYMDMIAALRWVKRNIGAFGGDAGAVTLFGQSAGGTAAMALMTAPAAAGLFHRAWMQSGSARYNTTLAQAEADNSYFLGAAGCGGQGVECLRAASTATLVSSVRWTEFPGWAGQGVSGFPQKGFSWGNLAIIDGHVIPAAPVDTLASGAAPAMVPLIIGSTGQETDLFPLTDVRNLSWAQFDELARAKMDPFGQDVVDATLSLYPHVGDPELQYSSLSSDIGVNCPQNVIAAQIARGWKAPLYRYVLTATPSHPMFMLGSGFPARYAFHTLDSVYLFNTTRGAMGGESEPTAADEQLTRRLRAAIVSFVRAGVIEAWPTYPATLLLDDAGVVTNLTGDYHAKACSFWESHGFWRFSWAGN